MTNLRARDLVRFSLRLEPSTFTIEQTEQCKPAASNQVLSLALASPTSSPTRAAPRQGQAAPPRPHRHKQQSVRGKIAKQRPPTVSISSLKSYS